MSESSHSDHSREHDKPDSDNPSTAEVLCTLGSLTGEHTVELSQMSSKGEPIPEAPHITIWTDEPNPESDKPLLAGMSTLATSPKDDNHPPFIVNVQAPHRQWFDYSEVTPPDGLTVDTTDDDTRLWFGRFDSLVAGIEAIVEAAEQTANASRTT